MFQIVGDFFPKVSTRRAKKIQSYNFFFRLFSLRYFALVAVFFGLLSLFFLSTEAQAQLINGVTNVDAQNLGLSTITNLREVVVTVIKVVLGFVGLVAVGVNIYAGTLWLTAQGNKEQISKAKVILQNGIIGLVIIMFSYAAVSFIFGVLDGNLSGDQGNFEVSSRTAADKPWFGSLGGGIIDSVLPTPYAQNVPRNTAVMIKFKEPLSIPDLISSTAPAPWLAANCPATPPVPGFTCGALGPKIKINTDDGTNTFVNNTDLVATSSDGRNFVFKPALQAPNYSATSKWLFGNAKTPQNYKVQLGEIPNPANNNAIFAGASALLKQNGDTALRYYAWTFSVGTILDNTAPRILSVIPGGNLPLTSTPTDIPRNSIVQITFSEPVMLDGIVGNTVTTPNPSFAPITSGVTALTVCNQSSLVNCVPGNWEIGNQFQTLRFLSSIPCSPTGNPVINSCGESVRCLPANTTFQVLVRSFNPTTFLGVQDLAGNSLDGNPTQTGLEDYSWNFTTNDTLDLVPPVICNLPTSSSSPLAGTPPGCVPRERPYSLSPYPKADPTDRDVPRRAILNVRFSKLLDASTINTENLYVTKFAGATCAEGTGSGLPNDEANGRPTNAGCFDPFINSFDDSDLQRVKIQPIFPYLSKNTEYALRASNAIRDVYQNCFNPSVIQP